MKNVAAKLKRRFRCNIPTIDHVGYSLSSIAKKLSFNRKLDIPPECYDLLTKLLEPFPGDRIAASEAIKHPFLI